MTIPRLTLGVLILIGALGATATTATASHCGYVTEDLPEPNYCCPTYDETLVEAGGSSVRSNDEGQYLVTVAGLVYVPVDALLSDGYLFSAWVYVESNGEDGLQRPGCSTNPEMGIF